MTLGRCLGTFGAAGAATCGACGFVCGVCGLTVAFFGSAAPAGRGGGNGCSTAGATSTGQLKRLLILDSKICGDISETVAERSARWEASAGAGTMNSVVKTAGLAGAAGAAAWFSASRCRLAASVTSSCCNERLLLGGCTVAHVTGAIGGAGAGAGCLPAGPLVGAARRTGRPSHVRLPTLMSVVCMPSALA